MTPYINIHTHHLSIDNGVFLFNNRFGFDKDYYLNSFFSIGIHPWDCQFLSETKLPEFENIISNQHCIAIGECGLDKIAKVDFRKQKHFFEYQLAVALKFKKPVLIHCVKAFDELNGICKPYLTKIPLIIHGFNKTDEMAQQLIKKGFHLSVSTPFLFKTKLNRSVLDNLFFETDDKSDISIIDVYALASQKFSIDLNALKEKINYNFVSVFKFENERG